MSTSGLLATSFASRLGANRKFQDKLSSHLPPMLAGAEEFRIDVTPLILYGELVMDGTAFDVITSSRYPKVQSLARQLADFFEAGLVKLRDFSGLSPEHVLALNQARFEALETDRAFWLLELRRALAWWESNRQHYVKAYGKQLLDEAMIPWSILAVLEDQDAPLTIQNVNRVRDAILRDETEEDHRLADAAVGALLNYTNCNRLNAARFGAPVMDWHDMQGFMTARDRLAQAHGKLREQTARFVITDIASVDVAHLRTSEVIGMLQDRRIQDFRTYVDECVERGVAHMPHEKERLYSALVRHQVLLAERGRSKFLTRLATSAVFGNLAVVQDLLLSTDLPSPAVKTTDDFVKSMMADASTPQPAPPPKVAFKAIYAIQRHIAA